MVAASRLNVDTSREIVAHGPRVERVLECAVSGRRIAVPLAHVDQLIEYQRAPLPLSHAHVAGLGIHAGGLVVSLSLRRLSDGQRPARAVAKGVLLRDQTGATRYCLEVDETLSFLEVERKGEAASAEEPWLSSATTQDGRTIAWLDVSTLVGTFGANGTP